jgi:ankyrin repeat protein
VSRVVYGCVIDHGPAAVFEELIGLGFDFSNAPLPSFEKWPKPLLGDIGPAEYITLIPDDPFFMELTRALVSNGQGEKLWYMIHDLSVNIHYPDLAGTTELQEAILCDSGDTSLSLIRNYSSFDAEVNFLGQTPLHLAVEQPSVLRALLDSGHVVDVEDKNGFTPLMYAAALGLRESAMILIERGANLFVKDRVEGCDFIQFMAMRLHWSLIWDVVDAVQAKDRDLLLPLFSRINSISGPSLCQSEGIQYLEDFWKSVEKLGTWDNRFENGSTLLHIAQTPALVKHIAGAGYTLFNQQDDKGEHCLFAMTKFLDPSLFQLCVGKGALVNLRNKEGITVIYGLFDHLSNPDEKTSKAALSCIDTLLDLGADINAVSNWACGCSSHGGVFLTDLRLEATFLFRQMVWNPFWIFELLYMLEERGQISKANTFAIAVIRRSKFDALGFENTSHSRLDSASLPKSDDLFWDIERQLKRDLLDSDMHALESASYEEVKLSLLREIRDNTERKELSRHKKGANALDEKESKVDSEPNNEECGVCVLQS